MGGADILRVHDVREAVETIRLVTELKSDCMTELFIHLKFLDLLDIFVAILLYELYGLAGGPSLSAYSWGSLLFSWYGLLSGL